MDPVVVESLTKDFKGFRAIDKISFRVKKGEIFGLLGPNGAGKTTTVMILTTLLKPTSGRAYVAGYDVLKEASKVRRRIGVVFQETTLDLELSAKENLDFHARLYGMTRGERERRITEVLEIVELEDRADIPVKKFSGGMKRRLEIARGLMHFPEVLFLDEPTLGLDAHTRRKIWDYILEAKGDTTVILTTHYIEEAEKLCNRVAIMDRGKLKAIDTPENLIGVSGKDVVEIECDDVERTIDRLSEFSYVVDGNTVKIFTEKGEEVMPEIIIALSKSKIKIKSAMVRKPTLEDVFIQLTK